VLYIIYLYICISVYIRYKNRFKFKIGIESGMFTWRKRLSLLKVNLSLKTETHSQRIWKSRCREGLHTINKVRRFLELEEWRELDSPAREVGFNRDKGDSNRWIGLWESDTLQFITSYRLVARKNAPKVINISKECAIRHANLYQK